MDDINKIIEEAKALGFEDKLDNFVRDYEISDPSLTELNRYTLAMVMCKEGKQVGMKFDRNTCNIELPELYKNVTNKMVNLVEELRIKQNENPDMLVTTTYSQIGQDMFVNNLLQEKRNGLFFDIGGGPPVFINNTYLLEKEYGWSGISIDAAELLRIQWQESDRKSKFLCEDALSLDYDSIITELLETHNKDRIDYLSVDLEPPSLTIEVLFKLISSTRHRFSVITFEHDAWREAEHILKTSRQLLERYGYVLVVDNVNNQEDWWVDGSY